MSWKALNWASEQITGSASNQLILIALANFADDDGLCFPKISTLSKISELSERQIIRCLKDLKYNGLLNVMRQYREDRTRTANVYQLNYKNKQSNMTPRHADSKSNMTQCHMGNTAFVTLQHDTMSQQEPPIEPSLEPKRGNMTQSHVEHEQKNNSFTTAISLLKPLGLEDKKSREIFGKLRQHCNPFFEGQSLALKDEFILSAIKSTNLHQISGSPVAYLQKVLTNKNIERKKTEVVFGSSVPKLSEDDVLRAEHSEFLKGWINKSDEKREQVKAMVRDPNSQVSFEQLGWFKWD